MPGRTVESLLELARQRSPEIAAMRFEAAAARERPEAAGALPDPTFRVELMDITNAGMDAPPSLVPSKIGGTKYTVMQMLPWFGKRDAMRGAAEADALAAATKADAAWLELSMRIKTAYAQYYLASESEKLTRERFEGGLALAAQLIDAETALTAARVRRAEAESDRWTAVAALRRALGLPMIEPSTK